MSRVGTAPFSRKRDGTEPSPDRYTHDLAAPLSQLLAIGRTRYLYGAERLRARNGPWYVHDALGSVRATLNDSGTALGSMRYDPWGQPQTSAIAPFGFTGEFQDAGMVYLRARWYNPSQGTLTSRDPFAGFPDTPYSLHPYQYAYSDPVRFTDPTGRAVHTSDDGVPADAVACAYGYTWNGTMCVPDQQAQNRGYGDSSSGGGIHLPLLVHIDLDDRLIFVPPPERPGSYIFTPTAARAGPPGFAPVPEKPGAYIFTPLIQLGLSGFDPAPPSSGIRCLDDNARPGSFPTTPRRPGLSPRPDGGWERGQMTDAEFAFLRSKAQRWGLQIVVSGSLTETDIGLQRRYDATLQQHLPGYRRDKPKSDLVETGAGDVDMWEGSGLNDYQIRVIREYFKSVDSRFKVNHPSRGYSLSYYPSLDVFATKGGAIVFEPDGTTRRIPAPWQRDDWPPEP